MCKFQLISDLHFTEKNYKNFKHRVKADNLMLCGDICSPFNLIYEEFISHCSSKYKRTFIVTGNHEYWGSTIDSTDMKIEKISKKYNNVFYLNNKYYMLWNGKRYIKIFGGTLWSFVDDNKKLSNDVKYIKRFSLEKRNKLYLDTVNNIKKYNNFDIVMTHHMPSYKLIHSKYYNSDINCLYASNCDNLLSNTRYWICGHTHEYINTRIGDTEIRINPCDKKDEIIDID